VTGLLICEECGRGSTKLASGWRGYLIDLDDGGEDEAAFFCPACVEREFLPSSDGRPVGPQPQAGA
jgi:hypothetical protein